MHSFMGRTLILLRFGTWVVSWIAVKRDWLEFGNSRCEGDWRITSYDILLGHPKNTRQLALVINIVDTQGVANTPILISDLGLFDEESQPRLQYIPWKHQSVVALSPSSLMSCDITPWRHEFPPWHDMTLCHDRVNLYWSSYQEIWK